MLITEDFVTALRSAFRTFNIAETIRPISDSAVIAGKTRIVSYVSGIGQTAHEFGVECARTGSLLATLNASLPLSAITAVVDFHKAYTVTQGIAIHDDPRQLQLFS